MELGTSKAINRVPVRSLVPILLADANWSQLPHRMKARFTLESFATAVPLLLPAHPKLKQAAASELPALPTIFASY